MSWLGLQLEGEHCNLPPPIFLKLSELQDSCMKRYPIPILAAGMHFTALKTAFKIEEKNRKTRKTAKILKTAGNIAKSSKFQSEALLLGVLSGMIIGIISTKYFLFKIERYF